MEPKYEENKRCILECMKQKQEEDIQKIRLYMYKLREQHIQVEPIFSFERDYKRMKEDYERGLRNISNIKSNNPFE